MKNQPNVTFPSEFRELSLALAASIQYKYRDFVATFVFYDTEGKPLEPDEVSASWSPKLGGCFRYLQSRENTEDVDVVKPIILKRAALSADVKISPWGKRDEAQAHSIQDSLLVSVKNEELGLTWTRKIKN